MLPSSSRWGKKMHPNSIWRQLCLPSLSFSTFFTLSSTCDSDFTPQWTWPTNPPLWPHPSGAPLNTSPRRRMKLSLAPSRDREVLSLVSPGLPLFFFTDSGWSCSGVGAPQVMFTLRGPGPPQTLIWSHWDGCHSCSAERGHNTALLPVQKSTSKERVMGGVRHWAGGGGQHGTTGSLEHYRIMTRSYQAGVMTLQTG